MAINLSGLSLASDGTGGGGGVTAKMKFIPVTTLPNADEAKKTAVYLVPAKNATSKNKYDEYVVLKTENGYIWELFGQDVSVDLQSFATKTELNKKQDKLVNQQNIRSVNGVPLIGAGNVNFAVFATEAEHKKVVDFVNSAPETYATKEDLSEIVVEGNGIKTINGAAPDANGNLNLAVLTPEQSENIEQAVQMSALFKIQDGKLCMKC